MRDVVVGTGREASRQERLECVAPTCQLHTYEAHVSCAFLVVHGTSALFLLSAKDSGLNFQHLSPYFLSSENPAGCSSFHSLKPILLFWPGFPRS